MSIEAVEQQIRKKISMAPSLKAKVKFDFGAQGLIFVDTTQSPFVLSHENAPSDTSLICSLDTFKAILAGTQDPNIAFMTGKLKIKGSMGLAMKLNAILED